MPKKQKITQEQKEYIKKLYIDEEISLRKICKTINKSQAFLTKVLEDEGIFKYLDGSKSKKNIDLNIPDDKNIIVVCKKTNKKFNDYKNSSGVLTEHIKREYPNLEHPSNYEKRKYKSKNGKYWHMQFFDILETEVKPTKKCKYCDWETIDMDNKSGYYLTHLKKCHNISIEQYLIQYPEENVFFKKQNEKINNKKNIESNKDNFVVCAICGRKLRYLTSSHLKTHDITTEEYKKKYPNHKNVSKDFLNKTTKIFKKASLKIKKTYHSKQEIEIGDFLKKNGVEDIMYGNRNILKKAKEIDIISHAHHIGIEFNGNIFHSELFGKKDKNYHINKTKEANNKNYGLIHIFEDEWEYKKEIIKTKLLHIFSKRVGVEKIYARCCEIKEISSCLKNDFLNSNHIQGEDKSNIKLGAFYNNKLVAVMTFDNKRQMNVKENDNNVYELKRFATSKDYVVVGIASKMLSYFIKNNNPKKIISFADIRWTTNVESNLYTKLGFKITKTLSPDYSYYNPKISRFKRFHKFSFGKNSIKKKYPDIYDNKKTEWEMMQELGYDRIWDCGKFKYQMEII